MQSRHRQLSMWFWIAAHLAACSSSEVVTHGRPASGTGGNSSGTSGTGPAATGTGVGGAGGQAGSGAIVTPDASFGGAPGADASCAGSVTEARLVPLDLFIMLDQSGSMTMPLGSGDTRWTAVTKAIGSFIQQPEAVGLGVGINYFGIAGAKSACRGTAATCMNDGDCAPGCGPCILPNPTFTHRFCQGVSGPPEGAECDVTNYAKAETPIAALPGNVQPMLDSLARHEPTANTPTSAALQGSADFCRQWATDHPGRVVVNVFATDGVPSGCDEDAGHITQIAMNAFAGTPSIRTFVIGVGNEAGTAAKALLDGMATAGGTKQAFVVTDADVNRQFLDALNQIRGASLACAYAIPDSMGRQLDFTKVNVRYTPGASGAPEIIPKVAGAADCANRDGWYYDDNAHPTRIIVCDATCQKFSTDSKGKVEIEVGCATIIAPPPK